MLAGRKDAPRLNRRASRCPKPQKTKVVQTARNLFPKNATARAEELFNSVKHRTEEAPCRSSLFLVEPVASELWSVYFIRVWPLGKTGITSPEAPTAHGFAATRAAGAPGTIASMSMETIKILRHVGDMMIFMNSPSA